MAGIVIGLASIENEAEFRRRVRALLLAQEGNTQEAQRQLDAWAEELQVQPIRQRVLEEVLSLPEVIEAQRSQEALKKKPNRQPEVQRPASQVINTSSSVSTPGGNRPQLPVRSSQNTSQNARPRSNEEVRQEGAARWREIESTARRWQNVSQSNSTRQPDVQRTESRTGNTTQSANSVTDEYLIEGLQFRMEFCRIPSGRFVMGTPGTRLSSEANEQPAHEVIIGKPFYMGKYPVTQAQWRAVMGNNPSRFKGDDRPVEQVSWNDAQDFINKLNRIAGSELYRLPTEAEWEYSCRTGTTRVYFSFGDSHDSKQANFSWKGPKETTPVNTFPANHWGLHDMHGNVFEWCQDNYASYRKTPADGSAWENKPFRNPYDFLGLTILLIPILWVLSFLFVIFPSLFFYFFPSSTQLPDWTTVALLIGISFLSYVAIKPTSFLRPIHSPSFIMLMSRIIRGGCWYYWEWRGTSASRAVYPQWRRSDKIGFRLARIQQ
ncbi:MAG: hypothetical protein C4575_11110 [Desulforudis sp.]|jgi:formylglycine-generating enzyme required for sulfatase activity|nr:MAG: hypothetical protein C4575_11110 [Desulforudis sp.]